MNYPKLSSIEPLYPNLDYLKNRKNLVKPIWDSLGSHAKLIRLPPNDLKLKIRKSQILIPDK